ncbi:hypothetical protein TrispH2_002505 [Trichoplax sp. H2]|nr:hypothetical protein TrispH2_002505 [Trichoplax sp. H2]|eukprot:RDD45146.1 hypothetical protein TrispH2_002505 [Trichoplax sp. H2]
MSNASYVDKDVNLNYLYDEVHILQVWQSYILRELQQVRFYVGHTVDGTSQDGTLSHLLDNMSLSGRSGALLVTSDGQLYQCADYSISICGAVNYESNIQGGYDAVTSNLETVFKQIIEWNNLNPSASIISQKIIFPLQTRYNHWTLGCLTLNFSGQSLLNKAEISVYDPFGEGSIRDSVKVRIENLLKEVFNSSASNVQLDMKDNSDHIRQQYDGTSCGAITAENGKDLLNGGKERLQKEYYNHISRNDLRLRHLKEVNTPQFARRQWQAQYSDIKGDKEIQNKEQVKESLIKWMKNLQVKDKYKVKMSFRALYNISKEMMKDKGENLFKRLAVLRKKEREKPNKKNQKESGNGETKTLNQSGLITAEINEIEKCLHIPFGNPGQLDALSQTGVDPARSILTYLKKFFNNHKQSLVEANIYSSILDGANQWQEGSRKFLEDFSKTYENHKNAGVASAEGTDHQTRQLKLKLFYFPSLNSLFQDCGCSDASYIQIENDITTIKSDDETAINLLRKQIILELKDKTAGLGQWVCTESNYQTGVKELLDEKIIAQAQMFSLSFSRKVTDLLVKSIDIYYRRQIRAKPHPPSQTGSAGTHLEENVQAYFLAYMITGTVDPILERDDYDSLTLQAEPQGFKTDDFVVTFGKESEGNRSRLVCQVKRSLKNGLGKAISQAWEDFDNPQKFNPKRDYIVFVTETYSGLENLKQMIKGVHSSSDDVNHFRNSIFGEDEKAYSNIHDIILEEACIDRHDGQINQKVFNFLQRVKILEFTQGHISNIKTIIGNYKNCNTDEALKTWNSLCKEVAKDNERAGIITREPLPERYEKLFAKIQIVTISDIDLFGEENFPPVNDYFTGRQKDLIKMKEKLFSPDPKKKEEEKKLLTLLGLGGVGKTYLALKFLHNAKDHHESIKCRLFFNADDEETLTNSYIELARHLNILSGNLQIVSQIRKVKGWLCNNTGWIILFDNATMKYKDLIKYIPQKGGYIVITTRCDSFDVNKIQIDIMTIEDSIELLEKEIGDFENVLEMNKDELNELVQLLDCLPLALVQAAGYIKFKYMKIRAYINLYKENYEKRKEMLEFNTPERPNQHIPVYLTWDMSFNVIKNTDYAENIITLCAYLSPNGIHESLLLPLTEGNHKALDEVLKTLFSLSLVKRIGYEVISIHKVLQEVIQVKQRQDEKHKQWIEKAIDILAEKFKWDRNKKDSIDLAKSLIVHITCALDLAKEANLNSNKITFLLHRIGVYYLDIESLNSLAEGYLRRSLEGNTGDSDIRQRTYRQLFKCLIRAENYTEAKEILEIILPADEKNYSIDDHCNLALLLMNSKGVLVVKAIIGYFTLPPSRHGSVEIYSGQKKREHLKEAQKQLGEARKKIEENNSHQNGAVHAKVLHYSGLCLYKQKQYNEAKSFFDNSLKLKRDYYNEDHFEIARTHHEIGRCYYIQKQYENSIKEFDEALRIRRKYYNSTQTLSTLIYLAKSYKNTGEVEKRKLAITLLEEGLKIQDRLKLSQDITLTLLAKISFDLKRREDSIRYIERISNKSKLSRELKSVGETDVINFSKQEPKLSTEEALTDNSENTDSVEISDD